MRQRVIIILALMGLFVSLYLLENHYTALQGSTDCVFNEAVSCDRVNGSIYAEIFHIPVAVFGIVWFALCSFFAWKMKERPVYVQVLLGWNILGLAFFPYFLGVEYYLRTLCPYCTIIHLLVVVIFVLVWMEYHSLSSKVSWKDWGKKMFW